jgi:Ca2+-binding EF-hand superfamily protein
MRSVGEAFLKKLGAKGGRIQEGYLEKKLEDLFHELDADGGGDIDFEEMSEGLYNMGVNVSKKDLRKLLSGFDSNGDLVLDMEEFKGMVKKLMLECKVH